MKVKDHSVSGETFTLAYDSKRHMYSTVPKPSLDKLPSYYQSEDYISHTDGKRSLFERVYQLIKQTTLSRKHNLLKSYLPNKGKLLDIGTGTGDFPSYLANKGWEASGTEPNSQARALAIEKGIIVSESLQEVTIAFDVITMWHVLEHVYDLDNQLTWLKSNLKESGFLFIAVPNFESKDAQHYKEHWAAYDVPRHLYHFSKKAIQSLFAEKGFELVTTHPMVFDAYYVSLLSEKYLSGKMGFIKAFINGWKSNIAAKKTGDYSSLTYVFRHNQA